MLKDAILCVTLITAVRSFYPRFQCPQQCICLPNFTDCKNNDFTELPPGIDPNVTVLDLSYNAFELFPENLNLYSSLLYLNLSHNQLQILTSGTFYRLKKLQRLDLTYNKFSDWMDIKSDAFNGAQNLSFLDISHNPLRSLPRDKNPLQIPSLTILRLNNCSMEYFNSQVLTTLPKIEELHLSGNPLKSLAANFVSKSLKFLDLSKCNLHSVTSFTFTQLTSLETLYMSENKFLKRFNCDSLSLLYLDLSDCGIEIVPTGNLPNVNAANFHGNYFREIPKYSFANYTSLQILDLSYNKLSTVHENAFVGLKEVQRIDLSQNTIRNLDAQMFYSNENLKFLNLSRNYFTRVPNFMSDSLENLDFTSCEIDTVDFDCLRNMPILRTLSLSDNPIKSLPDSWQGENLVKLDVSMCKIRSVNNKTFASMSSLREVNIAGNFLTSATPESFSRIVSLDISDNPWRCDCQALKPLYTWLSNTGKRMDGLYCQSPEALEGMTWWSACQKEWRPDISKSDTLWWYTTGLIVTVFVILFVVIAMRRMYLLKEKRLREADQRRRAEERETLRRQQRIQREMREEESRNAPDPRELQRPPSYHEALLLPRLDSSHPSLSGSLHSIASKYSLHGSNPDVSKRGRPRRKRRRRKSDSSEGQRASRVVVDSDTTSDPERPQPRPTLESDF